MYLSRSKSNYNLLCLVAQSCLALCDPMDCSPPGSSVHEIFQARILEWGAISFLQGIFLTQGSNPRLLCLLNCRWILHPLSHPGSPFCGDLAVLFLIRRGLSEHRPLGGAIPSLDAHGLCTGSSGTWLVQA